MTFPTPTMLYHLKEFIKECEKGIPGYFAPNEGPSLQGGGTMWTEPESTRRTQKTEWWEVVGEELRAELLDQLSTGGLGAQ